MARGRPAQHGESTERLHPRFVLRGRGSGVAGAGQQGRGSGAHCIVAVSALSPEHQQDAAADYVARRLRQITPTWGHSDDGNMLTNSSLLAHVN